MSLEIIKGLRAPGEGLLTISTGSAAADALVGKYFSVKERSGWGENVRKKLLKTQPFYILGVPSDSGGGICRGAAHGPLHLRKSLYSKHPKWAARDLGDIPCIPQLVHDSMLNENQLRLSRQALWNKAEGNLPVSPLNILEDLLVEIWAENPQFRPLVLGGDHSISGAIFSAMARSGKLEKTAVLHIDAHTDLLESRFGVEHCFGTWTAHAVRCLKNPALWAQIGIRASRHDKSHWERQFGLKQFWAKELLKEKPKNFAHDLLSTWEAWGAERLYITNDIDGTDSKFVPATGTPENKGLGVLWLSEVIHYLSRHLPLVGADLMEVAPVLGSRADAQKTLRVATKYLDSLYWH